MKKTLIAVLLAAVLLLSACGAEKAVTIDLQSVYSEIEQTVELPDMYDLKASKAEKYYGIAEADCKECIITLCSDSVRVDEIWLIEAVDASAAERIREAAQARIDARLEETDGYLPDQYAVVQKAQLTAVGNYVALFISPDAEQMLSVFNAAAK